MNSLGIKIVSTATAFAPLKWLQRSEFKYYVVLSKDSSIKEVDLFLIGLFGYNDIDSAENPKNGFRNLTFELKKKDCVALSGGFLFFNNNKEIPPSCCCGLESWTEVLKDFLNEESPWLGHDPTPVFEFVGEDVIVWSDNHFEINNKELSDANRDNLVSIKFNKNDFKDMLLSAKNDLKEFITIPLKNRIQELGVENIEDIISAFFIWLDIEL